jgi:hypothetical protein
VYLTSEVWAWEQATANFIEELGNIGAPALSIPIGAKRPRVRRLLATGPGKSRNLQLSEQQVTPTTLSRKYLRPPSLTLSSQWLRVLALGVIVPGGCSVAEQGQ